MIEPETNSSASVSVDCGSGGTDLPCSGCCCSMVSAHQASREAGRIVAERGAEKLLTFGYFAGASPYPVSDRSPA
jgi:hypothetical protein